MTSRDKIKYLSRYRFIGREIKNLEKELDTWVDRSVRTSSPAVGMPRGGPGDNAMQRAVEMIVETEQRIAEEIVRLGKTREEIRAVIVAVEDPRLREVLERRYILGRSFETIAAEMHYARSHVKRLHCKALEAIMIPNDTF